MNRKILVPIAMSLLLCLVVAGGVLAQDTTPPATQEKPTPWGEGRLGMRGAFGMRGGFGMGAKGWTQFDTLAEALKLTPTQLFEQLHSGKTVSEIAEAQGVDLQALQDAANAARIDAMKKAITDAVASEKITEEQGDWMIQGLDNGWGPGGRGFGHGHRGGRFGGPRFKGAMPSQQQPQSRTSPQA